MAFEEYLAERRQRVDRALDGLLPTAETPPRTIHAAMRYSLFAGGKRIRPLLTIAAAEALGATTGAEAPGCALECVHAYSLIHDDLPALDDDDFRRGRPTCHKVYGEAMAILAGDGLLTAAFRILAQLDLAAENRAAMTAELAAAAGTVDGMIGGQAADLEAEGKSVTPEQLHGIHRAKTGALIRAAVRIGALFGNAEADAYRALSGYGRHIGLAFQIVDDILDVVSTSEELGKTAGKDARQGKATFPALYGLEESRRRAQQHLEAALAAIEDCGPPAWGLRRIAERIVSRTK